MLRLLVDYMTLTLDSLQCGPMIPASGVHTTK